VRAIEPRCACTGEPAPGSSFRNESGTDSRRWPSGRGDGPRWCNASRSVHPRQPLAGFESSIFCIVTVALAGGTPRKNPAPAGLLNEAAEAAEGTRTLDLLHGKRSCIAVSEAQTPWKIQGNDPYLPRVRFGQFGEKSAGFNAVSGLTALMKIGPPTARSSTGANRLGRR
jgi:hypothetical protein